MCFPTETKGAKGNISLLKLGGPPFEWLPQGQGGDKEYNVSLCGDQITPAKAIKQSLSVRYWIELPVEQKGR